MNQERKLLSTANRLVVLVGEDLLATLAAGHAVLLLLAHLAGSKLLLLLGGGTIKYVSKWTDDEGRILFWYILFPIASNFSSSSPSLAARRGPAP
jgi:hypothetical protein